MAAPNKCFQLSWRDGPFITEACEAMYLSTDCQSKETCPPRGCLMLSLNLCVVFIFLLMSTVMLPLLFNLVVIYCMNYFPFHFLV